MKIIPFNKFIKKRLSCFLVIFLLFIFSCSPQTQPNKIYPPYPDIWGYDLSEFPAMKSGLAAVEAYAMDDGDFWFLIDFSYEKTKPLESRGSIINEQYMLIKFFKSEKLNLNPSRLQ